MITLVHGNDILSSRKFFSSQKKAGSIIFDAQNLDLPDLYQSIQGQGLFEEHKTILVENLFSKKAKNASEIIEFLSNNSKTSDIFIYSDKEISTKQFSGLGKVTDQNFKITESIFTMLEGLRPNSPNNVKLFRQALQFSESEIILFMLARQFRLLLSVFDTGDTIDEAKRLAPWQKSRLSSQAAIFGKEKLIIIQKKLYKLDKDIKTGRSKIGTLPSIDFLMLEI